MSSIRAKSKKFRLIVFEGADGVGKTTIAKSLQDVLQKDGLKSAFFSFPGIEDESLGKLVYELHHSPSRFNIKHLDQTSLQTLHIAAHIDAIRKKFLPFLKSGGMVILDRYWWSTWVYGKVYNADLKALRKLIEAELIMWDDILPENAFLIMNSKPYKSDVNLDIWNELNSEYRKLAMVEKSKYNVQEIVNNKSVNDIVRQIYSIIM